MIPLFDVIRYFLEAPHNAGSLLCGENTLFPEHLRMRDASFDIFSPESFIKRQRVIEFFNQRIGFLGKPSAPELCHAIPPYLTGIPVLCAPECKKRSPTFVRDLHQAGKGT